VEEHLGDPMPLDVPLKDSFGNPVTLSDFVDGQHPVVLSLVYFRCPMLCSLILSGLTRTMKDLSLDLGKDYRAVTVSFDPADTPADALFKQKGYLGALGKPEASRDWAFLTGGQGAIDRITRAAGFSYTYDRLTGQFAHPAVVLILTPRGRISRYLYEVSFEPRQLKLGLVEAAAGTIGSTLDRVILTCFHYDPASRRYGPWLFGFLRIGGGLVFAALGLLVGLLIRSERRARAAPSPTLAAGGPRP
jgi:protein SCO1/2